MGTTQPPQEAIELAAKAIRDAKALIITAGAGMGVDSGLPDFRGPEGFWNAYPPLRKLGLRLAETSTPHWFKSDPVFAWGFFGHRINLYRDTKPHAGFQILKQWGERTLKEGGNGYFVFTSNVDGHFQKAGFSTDRIVECHGSLYYLQCTDPSISSQIWPIPETPQLNVDHENLRLLSPLPTGPPGPSGLGTHPARPNVLMFSDCSWVPDRTSDQELKLREFEKQLYRNEGVPFVVIEIGAGCAVPTVRYFSEAFVHKRKNGTLIRINPTDVDVPEGHISLPMKCLEALESINKMLNVA